VFDEASPCKFDFLAWRFVSPGEMFCGLGVVVLDVIPVHPGMTELAMSTLLHPVDG
jgi:hypothetical protein